MIKHLFFSVILSVTAILPFAKAAPFQPADVSAKAVWLAHVDADAMRASSVMNAFYDVCMKNPEIAEKWEKMKKKCPVNLGDNLHGMTFYGTQFVPEESVLIVRAKIDEDILLKEAKKAPDPQVVKYGDYTIHTWTYKKHKSQQTKAGTLYKPDVFVMAGSVELLQSALDVLDGKADSLKGTSSPLAEVVPDYCIFLARAVAGDQAKIAEKCPILSQIKQLCYCEGQQGDQWKETMQIVTQDAAVAENIASSLKGLMSMFWLQMESTPKLRSLFDKIKISQENSTVHADFQASAEELIQSTPEVCKYLEQMRWNQGLMYKKEHPTKGNKKVDRKSKE